MILGWNNWLKPEFVDPYAPTTRAFEEAGVFGKVVNYKIQPHLEAQIKELKKQRASRLDSKLKEFAKRTQNGRKKKKSKRPKLREKNFKSSSSLSVPGASVSPKKDEQTGKQSSEAASTSIVLPSQSSTSGPSAESSAAHANAPDTPPTTLSPVGSTLVNGASAPSTNPSVSAPRSHGSHVDESLHSMSNSSPAKQPPSSSSPHPQRNAPSISASLDSKVNEPQKPDSSFPSSDPHPEHKSSTHEPPLGSKHLGASDLSSTSNESLERHSIVGQHEDIVIAALPPPPPVPSPPSSAESDPSPSPPPVPSPPSSVESEPSPPPVPSPPSMLLNENVEPIPIGDSDSESEHSIMEYDDSQSSAEEQQEINNSYYAV